MTTTANPPEPIADVIRLPVRYHSSRIADAYDDSPAEGTVIAIAQRLGTRDPGLPEPVTPQDIPERRVGEPDQKATTP